MLKILWRMMTSSQDNGKKIVIIVLMNFEAVWRHRRMVLLIKHSIAFTGKILRKKIANLKHNGEIMESYLFLSRYNTGSYMLSYCSCQALHDVATYLGLKIRIHRREKQCPNLNATKLFRILTNDESWGAWTPKAHNLYSIHRRTFCRVFVLFNSPVSQFLQ